MTTDLVELRLRGERAIGVRRRQGDGWTRLPLPAQRTVAAFAELIRTYPDAFLTWIDERIADQLTPTETWPAACRNRLEMVHVSGLDAGQPGSTMGAELGFVELDAPYLLPTPTDRAFITWLISPLAGGAAAAALRAAGFDARAPSFAAALFEAGHRGLAAGLLPRWEPALVTTAADRKSPARALPAAQIAWLIARLRGRRWLGFWLAATTLARRPRPWAAWRGLFAGTAPAADAEAIEALRPLPAALPTPAGPGTDIAALVPTLGRPKQVADLLTDLAAQSLPPRHVVVVEQGVANGEASPLEHLDRRNWPFVLERHTVPWIGVCRARNLGLARLDAPWIMFLDDDLRLPPHLLAGLLETAGRYGAEAVEARVHPPDEPPPAPIPTRAWPYFASGMTLVARALLLRAGDFDRRLEGGFGEDFELGLRFHRCGGLMLLDGHLAAVHLKAAIGGFRQRRALPWDGEPVPPKPSPTVLYARHKHLSRQQLDGYRLLYWLGRLRAAPLLRWPGELLRLRREWRTARHWCQRLLAGETPTGTHVR